jgi:hypothetical protein
MAKELRESREVSTVSRGVVNRKALKDVFRECKSCTQMRLLSSRDNHAELRTRCGATIT